MTIDGQPLTNVFTALDWRLIGTDGTNAADTYGQVKLGPPNPADFIPAASVTADDLVGWLTTILGADQIASLKLQVDGKLIALSSPPTFTAAAITASA